MKILTTKLLYFLFIIFVQQSYCNEEKSSDLFESKMNSIINLNNVDVSLIEESVIYLSNQYRLQKGKEELLYNKALNYAAYLHSSQMTIYAFFAHINNYEKALRNLDDRAKYAGYLDYEALSENIFYGYVNIKSPITYKSLAIFIVQNFIASKEHKENLLANNINEIGCGISFETSLKDGYWHFYFTQDFGKRF